MAPNGTTTATATSRKTPTTSSAKPAKSEENTVASLEKLFEDLYDEASVETKEDVKKSLPFIKKPGNWDSEAVVNNVNNNIPNNNNKSKVSSTPSKKSPQMNKIPPSLAKAFANSRPMTDRPDILKCIHCKRAVSKHVMPKHVEGCLEKKQEKQRKKKEAKDARDAAARKERNGTVADSDDEDEDGGKNTTADKTGGLSASKKRKAGDGEDDGAPAKKKKKKDDKAKAPKPKAPVDVEKQCGVELPNGGQCARSLTCKSHSMGAKRAVRRSAPYDKLLMEYQRKNQAKLQKAQFDANAPDPEDESLPTGPVDEDDEKDAMMSAIQRSWGGMPLYDPTPAPLRSKYQHNRIKGMLQAALGGRNGVSLFGTSASSASGGGGGGGFLGSTTAPVVDEQGIVHARRGSVVVGARSMMPPSNNSRRSSAVAT